MNVVPLPTATDDHQRKNAEAVAAAAFAALNHLVQGLGGQEPLPCRGQVLGHILVDKALPCAPVRKGRRMGRRKGRTNQKTI